MSGLSLSPSKIKNYERCPLSYRLAGEPRPEGQTGGLSPELALDRALHDTLDRFQAEVLRGQEPQPARLEELLRASWPAQAFASEAEANEALEAWIPRLGRFCAVQSASSARVLAGKTFVSGRLGGARVNGVVDRIDRLPGGGLELIDFRTGRPPQGSGELSKDLGALLTFAAACDDRKIKAHGEPLRFTQWFLQNQQRVSVVFEPEDLQRAARIVAGTAEGIEAGRFPARRGPHCSWCDQQEICPAWPQTPRQMAGEDQPTFAQRLRASYSKLDSYKKCPRAYSKVYVERVGTGEKPFFDLGKAVHEALEHFHGQDWPGADDLPALMGAYDAAFDKHQAGYRSEAQRQEYYQRGRSMLEAYHRHFVEPHGRIVAHEVEQYFELPLGKNAVINGFIDRIDRDEQGRLTVWDYKTEATERTQEQADQDLQLGIYAWACKHLLGQDVELGLYMLAHDQEIRTRRTDEQLVQIEQQVEELVGRMREDRSYEPKLNQHCPDCDFLSDCALRPEVEARLERGELRHAGFSAASD